MALATELVTPSFGHGAGEFVAIWAGNPVTQGNANAHMTIQRMLLKQRLEIIFEIKEKNILRIAEGWDI